MVQSNRGAAKTKEDLSEEAQRFRCSISSLVPAAMATCGVYPKSRRAAEISNQWSVAISLATKRLIRPHKAVVLIE